MANKNKFIAKIKQRQIDKDNLISEKKDEAYKIPYIFDKESGKTYNDDNNKK